MRLVSIAVLASLAMVFGGTSLPVQSSETESRIRAAAARLVTNQPDYTCLQTIDRYERRRKKGKFRKVDSVRVEVALIDGKEVFSWPGARQFDIENIGEIIPSGAASTGSFALHAKSIFSRGLADWTPAGRERMNGVACLKYAYRIPKHKSQYWLQTSSGTSIVGQHGHFWVDAETYDLVRIEVFVDDIAAVGERIDEITESIDYSRSKIGAGESVLPAKATSTVTTDRGAAMRNIMTFSACRQYVGESTISFVPVGEPPEIASAPALPAVEEFEIPSGLFVELVLETPLTIGTSVVGDQLVAHVRRDVGQDGAIVLPKGTRITGRVMALDHMPNRSEFHAIEILFDTAEFDGKQVAFEATLLGFRSPFPQGVTVSTSPTIFEGGRRTGLSLRNQPPSPQGIFYARAPSRVFQLPRKTVILYQTR